MFKALKRRQSNQEPLDELLSAYLDGLLPVDEQTRLEARLAREPALRDRLEGLRLTVESLAGLPEVEVPRNFILSPSMVAPQPTPRPRRRRAAPLLSWATAVVTLLFISVLAGDLFVIAPSMRIEPTDAVVRAPLLPSGPAPSLAAPTAEAGHAAATAGDKQEVQEAREAPAVPAEETAVVIAGTEPALVGAEPQAMTTDATAEAPDQVEAAVVLTPGLPAAEPAPELPLVASPPTEREVSEGEAGPEILQEQAATTAPQEVVMVVPLEETPTATGAQDGTAGVPLWLRGVEISLGLVAVGLAVATLIVRRRGL